MKAIITFADRNNGIYTVKKTFNDERHLNNYIAKVDGLYGNKYIDHEIVK